MKDKIGYTLGDLGCCFTEQYRAMYLSIFYTLILQVNPFHVGILLLITKIWDAVNDPIIGALVDSRKATKGGKFIPWIRAFSFPMAVLCVLGFVNVGNINYGLRLAYMFITYVLYEALYTCVNVPFGTLSSVMTDDVSQRTALSRYRSLGGTIFMTVMVMIGPLFLYVDNKPVAGRFLMLACICAMLGLLCLQITCVWCKERVEVPERPQGEKLNYLHVLKEISHNKALLGVMFFSLTGMIGASVVNGLNTYLYKDFFGNVKIQAVSGMLCLFPKPCQNLKVDHSDYLKLLRKLREFPNVKKVFIRSGIRFDYLIYDNDRTFLRELCEHHVSGQLKVAPEHVSDDVLTLMGKPGNSVYQEFVKKYNKMNQKIHKDQYLVPYLMSSHPGSRMKDAVELAEHIRDLGYMPEQVQDFYPTPSTISTCMYYTGVDPRTMQPVYVPKNPHEKAMQRAPNCFIFSSSSFTVCW